MTEEQQKQELRHRILLNLKANRLPTDEVGLMLVFRSLSELKTIAADMHIYPKETCPRICAKCAK